MPIYIVDNGHSYSEHTLYFVNVAEPMKEEDFTSFLDLLSGPYYYTQKAYLVGIGEFSWREKDAVIEMKDFIDDYSWRLGEWMNDDRYEEKLAQAGKLPPGLREIVLGFMAS